MNKKGRPHNGDLRVGEKRRMKNGLIATVIAYRGADDIDVKFEDGYLSEHKQYGAFLIGNIGNPNEREKMRRERMKSEYIGKSNKMNNGQMATVISAENEHDIAVRFEDGTVREHLAFHAFRNGQVRNPNYSPQKAVHIGEKKMMKRGHEAEIIAYRNNEDIDVRFDDGTEVYHRTYASFRNGTMLRPGEPVHMNSGRKPDRHFTAEELAVLRKSRIGEKKTMKNGQVAEIIKYERASDIRVRFEDGTEVDTIYAAFAGGHVRNPNGPYARNMAGTYLGMKKLMRCGMEAEIIRYGNSRDIDVRFENGIIKEHRHLNDFKHGAVSWKDRKPRKRRADV